MADDDSTVTIRFAADTAQLDAAIASVRAQLAGFNTEAANFAKQVSASAQVGNGFESALEAAGAEAKSLKSTVSEAEKGSAPSPVPERARAQSWPEPASRPRTSRAKCGR